MHRGRLNLVLLGVAAALAVAVYFSQEKEKQGPPLTALKPDQVTRIAIGHPDSPAIRLEKSGDRWALVAPVKADVDALELSGLIGLADRQTQETLDPAAVSLVELGLEPPQYTLTLNDTAIAFGTLEPLQFQRYVKVGDAISLIEDPPSTALDKDYHDLVARALFADGAQIRQIKLPQLTLARGADGAWTLTPADPAATTDRMQKLADGWKNARSMWNEMAQDAALRPKGEPVAVTLADGNTVNFLVTEREPQFKLLRPDLGIRYVLSKALTAELLQLPEIRQEEPKPASTPTP